MFDSHNANLHFYNSHFQFKTEHRTQNTLQHHKCLQIQPYHTDIHIFGYKEQQKLNFSVHLKPDNNIPTVVDKSNNYMLSKIKFSQLYFKDTSFANLMTRRIFNVLLIANPYDAFMLEDDGRIDEKLFIEYTSLSLRYPPRFVQVSNKEEAWQKLAEMPFDLIICMPGTDNSDTFTIAREIKKTHKDIPIVVLTPFSHGVTQRMINEDLSDFEYVFCWLGNTDLLLSIIKIIEDKMNMEHDINEVGVQMILLVEDSIRFYSSVLPHLYKQVLTHSRDFATEALNEHQKTLRMRGRPKIVLARTYEEAMNIYDTYKDHILGVITDVRFPLNGESNKMAGIRLIQNIRKDDEFMPIIMQSSEPENATYARHFHTAFIDKNSKKMLIDLQKAVSEHFGFGEFVFRNPKTKEAIAKVRNLKDLQNIIFAIPSESLYYHLTRNHISRWLYSRAMFPMAEFLKNIECPDFSKVDDCRKIIFESILKYRKMKNQGIVAIFHRDRFDRYSNFARIGEGSLGGKGRGLAFIDNMIKQHPELNEHEKVSVEIPKTLVLCTDIFDQFMEANDLYRIALSDISDEAILRAFLKAQLPERLKKDFLAFFDVVKSPLAIRSSSLLEDSHYQPFAGIYSTYMIPYLDDKIAMLNMLANAIKAVYASVYYRDSKAYMQATSNVIDEEKMAVVIQEVAGRQYGNKYYPTFSGVARSLNFYPIGDEKAEEGIVNLALGLGKYIVDGGKNLRFSPYHPDKILQTSELELAIKETQSQFFALDLNDVNSDFSVNDGFNILKLDTKEAEKDGSLQYIASTFNFFERRIYDGIYEGGRKLITFANVLKHNVFPLAEMLREILKDGKDSMQRPVEIEFAGNINKDRSGTLYILQIRPIVDCNQMLDEDLNKIPAGNILLKSQNSLGHGIITNVYDIVYVKPENFNAANNTKLVEEIDTINRKFLDKGENYVLVGPGRWGSSDPWLGIPVKWPNISGAKVIVESGLSGYRIEPSQGTHFFQNLTSFGVGYFTINPYMGDGLYDVQFLNSQKPVYESEGIRHIHFDSPIVIKMDGRKNVGVVLKPDNK